MTMPSEDLRRQLISAMPSVRAFALSLCGDPVRADDLVQETMVKAWAGIGSFQEGTNLKAWLFTILRNVFFSEHRKRRNEVEDPDGLISGRVVVNPEQPGHMEFEEFRAALRELPIDQREALLLVGAEGFSYEEAAAIAGCAVGTVKSRVNRARSQLARKLGLNAGASTGRGTVAGGPPRRPRNLDQTAAFRLTTTQLRSRT